MTKAKVVFNFLNPGGVWAKVALRTSVIVEDYHFVLDVENSVLFIRIIWLVLYGHAFLFRGQILVN